MSNHCTACGLSIEPLASRRPVSDYTQLVSLVADVLLTVTS